MSFIRKVEAGFSDSHDCYNFVFESHREQEVIFRPKQRFTMVVSI